MKKSIDVISRIENDLSDLDKELKYEITRLKPGRVATITGEDFGNISKWMHGKRVWSEKKMRNILKKLRGNKK